MELRKAAETLLRSQSSFLSSLLTSNRRTTQSYTPLTRHQTPIFLCQSCRHFSITSRLRQQAATKRPLSNVDRDSSPISDQSTSSPSSDVSDSEFLRMEMESIRPSGTSALRSRYTSSNSQKPQKLHYSPDQASGSSMDDLLKEYGKSSWAQPRQRYPTSYEPEFGSRFSTDKMLFPDIKDADEDSTSLAPKTRPRVLQELPIHLSARTGRTIDVDPLKTNDLGRAMRQLEMLCNRNRIRQDFGRQRFHERGGLKRKRLKSSRWRARFKMGFRTAVDRVQELRKQGW